MTAVGQAPAAARAVGRTSSPRDSGPGWLVALLGWTALISFYHLDGGAGFEPTDCWVAQTAREMNEGPDWHDWIIPRFAGETRMQKSPGPYWLVCLVARLRGAPVDEVAARIPNALAAVLLVATVFWLTRRIAGERAAIFAGFAAASSVMVVYWSHRAASDLGLAALIALSLACLWIAAEDEPPGHRRTALWLLGYFAAGLGMLYKMPMPLACVGLPVFLYVLIRWRWAVLANRVHLFGILLFLLPWLPWAIYAALSEPAALEKWRVEFYDRFTGDLPNVEGQRQWPYYFLYLGVAIAFCVPYSLSLLQALARAVRPPPGVQRDGALFALIWFLSLLVFFTASQGKETRYFLPAMPPLFVLLGVELAAFFDPDRAASAWRVRLGAWAVWTLTPVSLAAGAVGLHSWFRHRGQSLRFEWHEVWPPYAVTAALFTIGATAAAWLYLRGRRNASFGALVATMWAAWLWAWPNLMPVLVSQRAFKDIAAQLQERVPRDVARAEMRQVGSHDSRIVWFSDYRFPRIVDPLELLHRQGGKRSVAREAYFIGREMLARLSGSERVLLLATLSDYALFQIAAPLLAEDAGAAVPKAYVWLRTKVGREDQHFVLFSNQPPEWTPEEIAIPERFRARLEEWLARVRAELAEEGLIRSGAATTQASRAKPM